MQYSNKSNNFTEDAYNDFIKDANKEKIVFLPYLETVYFPSWIVEKIKKRNRMKIILSILCVVLICGVTAFFLLEPIF